MQYQYLVLDGYTKGYSHEKEKKECEDYSEHYIDPQNRYAIAAVCDGHSASLCFRSNKGAELGCKTAIEKLSAFFDGYFQLSEDKIDNGWIFDTKERHLNRLKKSIIQAWNTKVSEDIGQHPYTEEELSALKPEERKYCESPIYQNHAYGSTFIAVGMCKDFYIILQIGDGTVLLLEDGKFTFPLPEDEKGKYGAPTSLPDGDVLSRKDAFRVDIRSASPEAVFVMSDGIGDKKTELLEHILTSFMKDLKDIEAEDYENDYNELNIGQKEYLMSMLQYFADKNHGPEDDCSLAGMFCLNLSEEDEITSKEETQEEQAENDGMKEAVDVN